jgi:uncharacterized membrane protein YeiB
MAPSNAWRPVRPAERVELLDALRRFALFGIVAMNILDLASPAG